jgi:asparagine synthetase B (glutamine-hydrolysing)
MCGIFFSLGLTGHVLPVEELARNLALRGPDSYQVQKLEIPLAERDTDPKPTLPDTVYATFISSVLSLRGDHVSVQPFVDPASGSILCWNGEAWKFNGKDIPGNDTEFIFDRLLEAGRSEISTNGTALIRQTRLQKLLGTLSSITGPYAFIFFNGPSRNIFYGRDCLGRRSLLTRADSQGNIIVTSISTGDSTASWEEIEAEAIHVINISSNQDVPYKSKTFPWMRCDVPTPESQHLRSPLRYLNKILPKGMPSAISSTSKSVLELEKQLRQAVALRVQAIPLLISKYIPKDSHGLSKVAVLFSGGVDCTILARLAHDVLPQEETIDLLNVVFENPRIAASSNNKSLESLFEDCPDRITAQSSLADLRHACPNRKWRLVKINIPYHEALEHRQQVVSLIYPHNTEMDLSIAYALYFAARGRGIVLNSGSEHWLPYKTPARVLLSGLGADELFGGYTRHATAFTRHGFSGLIDELELDVNRLGKRNLGRDDRVISHWGREVRYPYLDEGFLNWALEAPVWEKCGFGLASPIETSSPDIEPGKQVLRLLAWKLGMHGVAKEKKRAIQFGARTAKMEKGKKKGTELLS